MKRIPIILFSLILVMSLASSTLAQDSDDLYIFGFAQVLMNSKDISYTVYKNNDIPFEYGNRFRSTSFALHQLNLFFQKPINERTIFFLNIETSGSYSSKLPSGHLEIPEGWISHRFYEYLEFKVGLLLPKFNNLSEIKNRLPLFPYLIRPILYESLFDHLIDPEDYKPQNAYFQISGQKDFFKNQSFEYAFYIGNAENSFLSDKLANTVDNEESSASLYLGESLNTALLFGARVGVFNKLHTFKTGISATYDEDNRTKEVRSLFRIPSLTTPVMGEVKRYRIGYDLSFAVNNFAFEGEYVGVFHNHSEIHKNPSLANANLNKFFYYVNLTYNFSDSFYAFGSYSLNKDQSFEMVSAGTPSGSGIPINSFGGGWRPFDNTSLKIQYLQSKIGSNNYLGYNLQMLSIGVSTIF